MICFLLAQSAGLQKWGRIKFLSLYMYNVHAKTFVTPGFNRKPEVQNLDCKSLSEMYLLQSCNFQTSETGVLAFYRSGVSWCNKNCQFCKNLRIKTQVCEENGGGVYWIKILVRLPRSSPFPGWTKFNFNSQASRHRLELDPLALITSARVARTRNQGYPIIWSYKKYLKLFKSTVANMTKWCPPPADQSL